MRYKTILDAKIEEEIQDKAQQEALKKKWHIAKDDVTVKKRAGRDLAITMTMRAAGIIRYVLAAIGVLAIVDPALRNAVIALL